MLEIRPSQLSALEDAQQPDLVASVARHIRAHFPDRLIGFDDLAIDERARICVAAARGFGLSSERDLLRYANLAATFGWTFPEDPTTAWMRSVLDDARYGSPSQRLHVLVRSCLRRLSVEIHNRRLEDAR